VTIHNLPPVLATFFPDTMLHLFLPSHSQSADGTLHFYFVDDYSKLDG